MIGWSTGARVIGALIAVQGIFGLALPDVFLGTLRVVQTPPLIYGAAVVRFLFGFVLFRVAPAARTPMILRVLGALIMLGGLLTPFVGARMGHAILDSWAAGGPGVVRVWAAFSLALGIFIVYATTRRGMRSLSSP